MSYVELGAEISINPMTGMPTISYSDPASPPQAVATGTSSATVARERAAAVSQKKLMLGGATALSAAVLAFVLIRMRRGRK
jgi:hypothetical protein